MIPSQLKIVVGDITEQEVDAIVNAANRRMLGGGGVDGAIHRAAGRKLFEECLLLGGCEDGEAKITAGHNLPSKHVIHTVGPIYGRANGKEAEILASCYQNSMRLAKERDLRSIAFPAISTGVYGYPKAEAAAIAVRTVKEFLAENESGIEVRFVFLSQEDAEHHLKLL